MLLSEVKRFKFKRGNRYYDIDLVYGVIAIEGNSGVGKSLFAKDLFQAVDRIPKPFTVYIISPYSMGKDGIERILSSDAEWFKDKIMVIDDTEMMDIELLSNAIFITAELNTQWVLLGHGCFVGLRTVGAYRQLQIDEKDGKLHIKIELNDILK